MRYFGFFFAGAVEVFPGVWSDAAMQSFHTELKALEANADAYRDAVARRLSGKQLLQGADLERMRKPSWLRAAAAAHADRDPHSREMLEAFIASRAKSLDGFCRMLQRVHDELVEPTWGPIERVLRDDVTMRAKILREHGAAALLRTLSPEVRVQRARLGAILEFGPGDADLDAGGAFELALAPSFFTWPHTQAFVLKTARGLRCSLTYPLPPLPLRSRTLADRNSTAKALAAMGDPVRLHVLELLGSRELSTRELAGYLRMAEPVISRHLRILRAAHLVTSRRAGYFVLYSVRPGALAALGETFAHFAR